MSLALNHSMVQFSGGDAVHGADTSMKKLVVQSAVHGADTYLVYSCGAMSLYMLLKHLRPSFTFCKFP